MQASPKSRKTFLLVIPRLVQSIGDGYSFPLGIPYVSASLKQAGYQVVTLNLNHREGTVEAILREFISAHGVDVVATGGLSFQYNTIREVIETAKRISPALKTVVGGGIITSDPETAMRALEHADFGVIGEGEHTIRAFAAALETDGVFEGVNGLIYAKDGPSQGRGEYRRLSVAGLRGLRSGQVPGHPTGDQRPQ